MPKKVGEQSARTGDFTSSIFDPANAGDGAARKQGSSFEARFGRAILQHGIAAIPSALFHYQGEIGLKAQHVWFISYILSHKWDEDLPYPSLSNMARCAGVTLRNIQFIKSDLCRAGMLRVSERYNGKGGRDSNAYDFSGLFAHLEELIAQDPDLPNKISAEQSDNNFSAIQTLPSQSAPDSASGSTIGEGSSNAGNDAGSVEMRLYRQTGADPSFVARFGRVIARRGVAAVPRAIFTHQKALNLTPQQVWFISYIFSFQWTASLPYPSINKMVQHTGYSRAHLHTIKAELVDAGYLKLVHRTNDQGGQDSNAYDFSGLLEAIRAQLQPDEPLNPQAPVEADVEDNTPADRGRHLFAPRRGQGGAKKKAEGKTDGDAHANNPYERWQTGAYEEDRTPPYETEQTGGYESQKMGDYESQQTIHYEREQPGGYAPDSHGPMKAGGRGSMKHTGHERESSLEANKKKDDSNRRPTKIDRFDERNHLPAGGGTPKVQAYSPYIAGMASDFSDELGDSAHKVSNMRQSLNLWQQSGLGEGDFVELMQQARQLTRRYQSRPTWDAMSNKMAYYFTTLRDLVALASDAQGT